MIKKRILIVDDDQISRDGVAELLEDEGFTALVAADGAEALPLLVSYQLDLVLTDLHMPKLDGLGLLDHLRNRYPTIPVIIFTAEVALDAKRKAEALGAQDYINKPLNFDDLLMRVKRVLDS